MISYKNTINKTSCEVLNFILQICKAEIGEKFTLVDYKLVLHQLYSMGKLDAAGIDEVKMAIAELGIDPSKKIPAVKIVLERAEGQMTELGEVKFKASKGDDLWDAANKQLSKWAITAPNTGCYDKTYFKVVFADGNEYGGRFDLKYEHYGKADLLSDDIIDSITFYGGINQPAWMKDDQYQQYLNRYCEKEIEDHRKFLIQYQIG